MTFKNRRARAAQPSGGGVHPSALAIDAGLATLTTFVGRERTVFGKLGLTRVGTAHAQQTTKDGRGLANTASATYWAGAAGAKVICASTSFAVLLSFYLRAPGQTNRYALFERLTGGTGSQNAVLYGYATDQFEFYSPSATGTDPRTGSGITVADSLPHTLIYTYDGATWSGLLDGRVIFSTSRSFAVPLNDATGVSSIGDAAGGNSLDICVLHHATFARGLPLNLARRLSSPNGKWSLFAGGKRRSWAPGAAGGAYTLTADSGSYTLTGQAAGLLAGRVLAAAQGSYTLSGQAAALIKGNVLAAAQGAYALTGQDVGLLRGLLLSAAQGSYALSGQDATLTYTPLGAFSLTADQGSYTLTGQSVSLLWGPVLAAGQGSYTLNGQDATLTYTPVGAYILTAGQGSYALTGQDVLLQWGHVLAAAQGSYALTGQDVSLARGLLLAAAQGSYTLTGQDAAFARTYVLSAGYGSYALTGQIVSLTYSGAALEALEYLLLISHITQSVSKTSKVTMEVDLISRIQQQLDGSSSI